MIKPLTSLRFFFALFVFFSHTGSYLKQNFLYKSFYDKYLYEGYLGVSFFFILSGFVLAYSYKNKMEHHKITNKEFWIARVARIYPLHLITLMISIPVSLNFVLNAKIITVASVFIAHIFLLQSYIPQETFYFNFNGPSWSISDEFFFYLMFPFLINFFYSKKSIVVLFLYSMLFLVTLFFVKKELLKSLLYINPLFRLFDFILGIILFNFYVKLKNINWFGYKATICEFLVIAIFLLFFLNHDSIEQQYRYSIYYWIPMSLMILVFSFNRGFLSKILSSKTLFVFGEISFSFYMIHQLTFSYLKIIIFENWIQLNPILFISISFSITLLLSYLSFLYIEKPLNLLIKTYSKYKCILPT